MNLYELSQLIIGTIPPEFNILYGILTFVLSLIGIIIIISPIIILLKIIGGR